MNITVYDHQGRGILADFAQRIGATVSGRFVYIPKEKGSGYLTGFSWGNDMRMMIRNYHLNEAVSIEWTNPAIEGQEPVVFQLHGIFTDAKQPDESLVAEPPTVQISKQTITSILAMPSHTAFRSLTIAVFKPYLHALFGSIDHPILRSLFEDKGNFAYETALSADMLQAAADLLRQPVPHSLETAFYQLKCTEILYYIVSQLISREPSPMSSMHMDDIRAIYAVKLSLQSQLSDPPDIGELASQVGISKPKLRRLFKQTFGQAIFEYYQALRMQEAARLLKLGRLTVSEVGYRLGFTNLSHFTRLFEQHQGTKPKKYSASQ
ncbi:helix-turn-helix transcriptional regulator [Spirosoma litoris]